MSGDMDARAAEYVLGTLTAHEAAAMERDMAADPALAAAVAAWERRLAPLTRLALPEAPPDGLWDRIEAAIAPPARVASASAPRRRWLPWALGGWAAAATAAALVLMLSPQPGPLMTVMLTDRAQTAWTAAVGRDGAIRLAAIGPVGANAAPAAQPQPGLAEDRSMQLWVLPPGATTPTSLGLLPRDGRSVTVAAPPVRPVPGMLIEITLEPRAGSPIGRPTGPVLFIGRLSEAGPPT